MQDVITPITDEYAAKALSYLLSREKIADPQRRAAVLAHRRHEVQEAENHVRDLTTAIAAAEITLNELKKAKERAVDVLVDRREDLKLAEQDEVMIAEAA